MKLEKIVSHKLTIEGKELLAFAEELIKLADEFDLVDYPAIWDVWAAVQKAEWE